MTEPEQALRSAFEAAAERVDVAPDALPAIRARVGVRARRRRMLTVSLAAAASVAVVAGGVAYALGRPVPVAQPDPAGSTVHNQPTAPATEPSSPAPGTEVRVPVYLVGETGKLFREFHFVAVAPDTMAERIHAAVSRSLSGISYDPDYDTAWPPEFGVAAATVDGGVAILELTGPAAPSNPIAAQQLVYTATAVAADSGEQLSGVRILVNGVPLPGGDLVRAPALETLAPLWLISPQYGVSVGRPVDVHVAGAVYEATARIRVRDAGGAVVEDTFVTLDQGAPARGEAHLPLTLAPGRYTIEVFFESPEDGSEQGLDDHEITVL